ncbi:MAG: PIN domain-containing protein [Candidatus Lokiarchaeota archaeon]|nr:PIN domain-containing protein [Candidatus Lokiarchaeota archaeon]
MYLLDTNAMIVLHEDLKSWKNEENLFTTILNVIEFPIALRMDVLTILFPLPESYIKGIEYSTNLRKKGTPIATIDIMIGVLAVEHGLTLVTDDKDFTALQKIESKLNICNTSKFIDSLLSKKK